MPAFVYMLRLNSGGLYIGVSRELVSRISSHFRGTACRTTALDRPIALIYSEKFETLVQARKRENQLKPWSRAKKEALIRGDRDSLKFLAKSRRRINKANQDGALPD